jgi:hypothetical protein
MLGKDVENNDEITTRATDDLSLTLRKDIVDLNK